MPKPQPAAKPSEPADLAAYRDLLRGRRGGPHAYVALIGLRSADAARLDERVRQGLAFGAFERLQRNFALGTDELAGIVRISPRTLARRRAAGRLSPEESDRLVRASRVFGRALALFEGDVAAARRWLATKAPALGDRTPLEAATTEVGAREVENLAGRLEHGVFS
jgi:putative toxin-antitoxin system antitoxin component (TIGR02293 family)